ncbi:MAG: hemolysin family protein [Methanimicrococcus sp.]|nr:hemolysin family protein [Methanimicrococcus sp.]
MEIPLSFWFALLFALLSLSAFFGIAETSYSMANKLRLKPMADDGNAAAKRVLKLTENYDKFISTVLVGNNIVNISSASIATLLFIRLLPEETAAAVSTVVMTAIILVFCETLPKSLAKSHAEKLSMAISPLVDFFAIIFSPIVFVLVKLINLTGTSKDSDGPMVTEGDLKYIIETIDEEGVLAEGESELVQSALDFDETTAQEIMTPRSNVIAINIDDDIDTTLRLIIHEGYTRMPVYKDTIDNIIGVINTKDVLTRLATGRRVVLNYLVRPVTFAYVTKNISPLLTELRRNKTHLAVVVDEYGSMKGIVTMEDILEELVGEIWDEYDEIITEIVPVGDNVYEVNSNTNIEDLFDYLDVDRRNFECDYNTAGGWALAVFERIPKVGESFSYKNLIATILEADEQRVLKLKIEKTEEPVSDEETKYGIVIEEKGDDEAEEQE